MNFGFKSTFNKLLKTDHSAWLLVSIIVLATGALLLYQHNLFIPATYGSKPNGDLWVLNLKRGASIVAVIATYAFLRQCYLRLPHQVNSHMRQYISSQLEYIQCTGKMLFLQSYMLVNLMLREPQPSRYTRCNTIIPPVQFVYIINY